VLSGRDVPRVDRVEFAISVGTSVPSHVRVVAVPDVLIQIHPDWRGHQYFVVRDEIVIVDSGRRIVATLPVGSSSSAQMEGGSRGGGQASSDAEITLSSDEIRQLQVVLKERGFDIGEPDGVFGTRTRQALIQFQQRNGLQANGRIDMRTTAALGISTKSGQQGQGPGNQPTTGQGGSPQQQGGNQPSANQPSDPSMNRGQSTQGGNQPGTTGQGRDNMQQQQPSARDDEGGARSGNQPSMNQNNPSSGAAPKSGGQSK